MGNNLSNQLLAEMFNQESDDPFLMLVTLSHPSFSTIYLVNDIVNQFSRGNEYEAFPMTIKLPTDDGESIREASIEFDNVSLELIDELRSVDSPMDINIEMVLASDLDTVQLAFTELKLKGIQYDRNKISAKLYMDSFFDVEMTSEKYSPTTFPGMF